MNLENDTFALVQRMRQMVYSLKDFNDVDFCRDSTKYPSIMALAAPKVKSLWFLHKAEGLPKNISIEEFCTKHGVDFPTFDKWYRKTHKKVYPITVTGMPAEEEAEI